MKNVSASAHMGSWTSSTARSRIARAEDPLQRYQNAKRLVALWRVQIQAMIDKALAAGFELIEALGLPAIRQALAAARRALGEFAAARRLLPS